MLCVCGTCVSPRGSLLHPSPCVRTFLDVVLDLCQTISPLSHWSLCLGSSVLFKCRVVCSHLLAVPRVRQQDVSFIDVAPLPSVLFKCKICVLLCGCGVIEEPIS